MALIRLKAMYFQTVIKRVRSWGRVVKCRYSRNQATSIFTIFAFMQLYLNVAKVEDAADPRRRG
jgi:hypothetical protein